ncbi:MAG: hypothetical protein ACAH10_03965 [Methylophilaceae bacterium]
MSIEHDHLQQWNKLESMWEEVSKEANLAQVALNFKLRNYIVSDKQTPAPTLEDQETVDKIWFLEAKRRNAIDEFIAEHFKNGG